MPNNQNQSQGGKGQGPQVTVSTGPNSNQIVFNGTTLPVGAGQAVTVVTAASGKTVSVSGQIANSTTIVVNPA